MNQECNANKKFHLRQCHCFNLRQVTLAVTALYDKYLQEAGITVQQYSILWHSKELGPLSITELALTMNLDRTTLSRNITLLTKRGLMETAAKTRSTDSAGTSRVCAGLWILATSAAAIGIPLREKENEPIRRFISPANGIDMFFIFRVYTRYKKRRRDKHGHG